MKLLVFPHSHYCEKARWALDYKGLPFQLVPLMPGFHIITVRKHVSQTSVPVLLTDTDAIQGSNEIINYLVAGQFSRADLSVAAMLSLLVMPKEHPFPWREFPGNELQALYEEYETHPVTTWVRKIYRTHRLDMKSN